MVFSATITSTLGQTEATAASQVIHITRGLVYFFEVYFPPGSAGLLHVRILDSSFYLLPSTPGESLIGNDTLYKYDDLYLKESEPFQFIIQHWNEDDTYNHLFVVHIGIVSKDVFKARFMPTVANEEFAKMLQGLLKEKEVQQEEQKKVEFTILGKQRA